MCYQIENEAGEMKKGKTKEKAMEMCYQIENKAGEMKGGRPSFQGISITNGMS
jgi:hypothetical protein